MGGAVLTTATLAGVSMFFALSMALNAPPAAAAAVTLVWFLAILNLDRWLVASLQRSARKWDIAKIAIPRAVLAVLFGVIISTPLVLQIFSPEVEAEITKIRIEQSEENQRKLNSGAVAEQIGQLKAEEAAFMKTLSSGGSVSADADPEVARLGKLLGVQEKKRDKNADAAVCEETGNKCKGRVRHDAGKGPYWREYKRKQADAEREIEALRGRIAERSASFEKSTAARSAVAFAEAKKGLPLVQGRLKLLQDTQSDAQSTFEEKNKENKGFLMRLKALNRASGNDFTLGMARLLLFLLITTLECLPIFVKILFLVGRPTKYDELLEEYEKQHLELGKQNARTERQVGFLANNDEIIYSDYVASERAKVLRTMAELTADAELRVARTSIEQWRDRELRLLPDNPDRYVQVTGTTSIPESAPMSSRTPTLPMPIPQDVVNNGDDHRRVTRLGTLTAFFRRGR